MLSLPKLGMVSLFSIGFLGSSLVIFFLLTYCFFSFCPIPNDIVGDSLLIRKSMTLRQIVKEADQKGLVAPFWVWRVTVQIHCAKYFFYAGYYDLIYGDSIHSLIERICRGKSRLEQFTILEGSTWKTIRKKLDSIYDVKHNIRNMTDKEILLALGDKEHSSLDGLLFPDTYWYAPGEDDLYLLRLAYRGMVKKLNDIWIARDSNSVPLRQPYELLTVASLIEKEVNLPNERFQVASVFYNRLRSKMLLQTDSSVCYDGRCLSSGPTAYDLSNVHPHNTYLRPGVPPTPICFPSESSLISAAHPNKTSYYYFVAKGDGSSYFSRSLLQHNKAVHRFLPGRGRSS